MAQPFIVSHRWSQPFGGSADKDLINFWMLIYSLTIFSTINKLWSLLNDKNVIKQFIK